MKKCPDCGCDFDHHLMSFPCGPGFLKKKEEPKPQVELDGEITLYESSLGWLPFRE